MAIYIGGILSVAAICFIAMYAFRAPQTDPLTKTEDNSEALLQDLSRRNYKGVEKQVVEKIHQLLEQVRQNPTSAFAWGKLGMNLDVHDLKKEAMVCYRKASVLNPEDFRWPYYTALVLSGTNSAEALTYFERSTNLKSDYAPAWIRYGQTLFDAGRSEEASEKFNRALQIEANSHAYVGLARIQMGQGKLQDSLTNLLEAVRIQPKHGEARGLLSEVYRRLNQPADSQRELLLSQQLPKRTILADEQTGQLTAEGVSSYWYDVRGRSYLEQGQYEAAIREFTVAAKASPDPRYFDTLGIAHQYLKRYDEAAKYHRRALELKPKSAVLLNNLAAALFEAGKHSEALDSVETAIQTEPKFPYSYQHLARLHLRSGNRKAALAAYKSGYDRFPQNAQMATQFAWLLATDPDSSSREEMEAVKIAEDACKRTQFQDPESVLVLSATYAETNQFDRAVETANQARKLAENMGANELLNRIDSHLALYQSKRPYRE